MAIRLGIFRVEAMRTELQGSMYLHFFPILIIDFLLYEPKLTCLKVFS